ncbi:hypothetical protein [Pantoea stewartii]|uniref:hypothetical protein n=1 Tax=Pantoea stewartii TaxID=66269 RepID=UPI0025A2FEB1|nr:hypothetical protein [Pantoea stewartii]
MNIISELLLLILAIVNIIFAHKWKGMPQPVILLIIVDIIIGAIIFGLEFIKI